MQITKYHSSDRQTVKQIVLSGLKELGFEHDTKLDFDLENPEKYYIKSGGMFFVLKVAGKVVGTIAVINKGKVAELKRFYIDQDYQGQGFGSQLLDKAIQFCKDKGFTKLEFETDKRSSKAHLMYKRRGFQLIKEDENSYYMEKSL